MIEFYIAVGAAFSFGLALIYTLLLLQCSENLLQCYREHYHRRGEYVKVLEEAVLHLANKHNELDFAEFIGVVKK